MAARRARPDPEVLTTPEACRFLRINKRTYLDLVKKGEIKAKKLGRGYKVLKQNLVKYLGGE